MSPDGRVLDLVTWWRGNTAAVTPELATLRLEPAVVTRVFLDGNITRHPESHFLDLVVDGRSLRHIARLTQRGSGSSLPLTLTTAETCSHHAAS